MDKTLNVIFNFYILFINKTKLLVKISFLLIILSTSSLVSQEKKYYFYNPLNNFGSDLTFNPITLMINGSFDILRNGGTTKNIFELPYKTGIKNVVTNITHPKCNIEKYGWKNFRTNEIFNTNFDIDRLQFLPNISLHLIGNGMQYIKLAEWYEYHSYPHPYLLSSVTTLCYQFFNEVIENNNFNGSNVDPIADILIFNPLGFLIFSTEFGKEMFSKKIPIYDWSCQPFYNPGNHFLENSGQQFASKLQFSSQSRYSIFMYWGVQTIFGLSYKLKNDFNISFGAGSIAFSLTENRIGDSRIVTPLMKNAIGIFCDKNNSLLTSVIIAGHKYNYIKIEVFPGPLKLGLFKPGFFVGHNEFGSLQIGLTSSYFPVGLLHDFF